MQIQKQQKVVTQRLSVQELQSNATKEIGRIISETLKEFDPEIVRSLNLSTYALSSIVENSNFKDAVNASILRVVKEYAVENRLLRRIWNPVQFRVSESDIEDSSLVAQKLREALPPGLYEITYLEPKYESATYGDSLKYLRKSGALFLGIDLLRILQDNPEWVKDDTRAITVIDDESSHYLLKGEIYPSSVEKNGLKDYDILVHFVKLS